MPSQSEDRRKKAQQDEAPEEELQAFSYPTLGGAVIRAKNQKEADKIAAKLSEDLKTQEAEAKKKADADKSEA